MDGNGSPAAGPAERGRLRRRLRGLKRTRDRRLADLGTLVVDARKRSNGSRPEVVDRRAAETAEIDRQVRELSHAVDAHADRRVIATGVRGSCRDCGTLLATDDRFCPGCGAPAKPGRARPADTSPVAPGARAAERAAPAAAPPQPAPMPGSASAGPPPPSPTAPYAAVDPAKIPPPPPPPPPG